MARHRSGLLTPPRAILKPDRPILSPGWDDSPEVRPRGGWWRRLLAGRAGLTRLQPGTCCGCGPAPCCGLSAPQTLTVSWSGTCSGSTTFTAFSGGFPCQNFSIPCGSGTWAIDLECALNPGTGLNDLQLSFNENCPGGGSSTGCNLFPTSTQCSPLLLTYDTTGTFCHFFFTSFTVSP